MALRKSECGSAHEIKRHRKFLLKVVTFILMFPFKTSAVKMILLGILFHIIILGSFFLFEFRSSPSSKLLQFLRNDGKKSTHKHSTHNTPKEQHTLSHTLSKTIQPVIPSLIRIPADVARINDAWDTSLNFSLQLYEDIHIETFPTAYFVNVFEFQDGIYASYRTSLVSWHTNVARLDDDFTLIQSVLSLKK